MKAEEGASPIRPGITRECDDGVTPPLRPSPEGEGNGELPAWVAKFFAGLIVTGSVREAVAEAGIDFETAWAWREEFPVFAHYWDRGVRVHRRVMSGWDFLDAVAAEEGVFQ